MDSVVLILLLIILGIFLWWWWKPQLSPPREYGGAGGFGVISDLDEDSGFYIR